MGTMVPIGIKYHSKKGYQIIHRCKKCKIEKKNIIAQDCKQPDNFTKILAL